MSSRSGACGVPGKREGRNKLLPENHGAPSRPLSLLLACSRFTLDSELAPRAEGHDKITNTLQKKRWLHCLRMLLNSLGIVLPF